MKILKNVRLIGFEGNFDHVLNGHLLIDKDRISIIKGECPDADAKITDMKNSFATPGMIDIHIHGLAGMDFSQPSDSAAFEILRQKLAENGTVAFLPTIRAEAIKKMIGAARRISNLTEAVIDRNSAEILGINLEGPFLSKEYSRFHAKKDLQDITADNLKCVWSEISNFLRVISISPEIPGAFEAIRFFSERGVIVSVGHTGCSLKEFQNAVACGARSVTHIYNGMPPMHHRRPGPVYGALTMPELFAEFIGDGRHIVREMVLFLLKNRGVDNCILISDSTALTMFESETIKVGSRTLQRSGKIATDENGVIAGAATLQLHGIYNLIDWGIPFGQAVKTATYNPARLLGLENERGIIKDGAKADILIFNEKKRLAKIFKNGLCIHATSPI